jgi:hypothetical protein
MTTYLPYRARVYCSLGELISGQFADTYLQQAGLIFCRGSIELAGIYRPTIGTPVEFAYSRGGSTAARIPRKLRVLSSFADPFTKRTSVQIGCKLSLLADNRQPDKATPEDTDPGLPTGWEQYFAAPVRASAVAEKCLTKLGITAADTIPLTSRFTRDFIDLSAGYVEVLGKLLESECYVGWLNDDEELQIRSLIATGSALGPVFNNTNVFTLSPIGSATLPGEAVTVTYDPLRLKPFSISIGVGRTLGEASGWTSSITFGQPAPYSITYEGGSFTSSYIPVQETISEFGSGQLVRATTSTFKPFAAVAGKYAAQALTAGVPVSLVPVASKSVTVNAYDANGRVSESVVSEIVSTAEFTGNLDLTFVNSSTDFVVVPSGGEIERERTITRYLYSDGYVRREVQRYQIWAATVPGQQAVNESRGALATTSDVSTYINRLIGAPVFVGSELNITDSGPQEQSVPGPAALTRQAYGKLSLRESVSLTEYVFGSSSAERTITFSLPYTGDDYVSLAGSVGVPVAGSLSSKATALNYGRLQNRLRLGNAQGVSLQVPVELLPTSPFDALYLQVDGLTGQYRANGMSWTFDPNGIMGQLDALFWQATGQSGTPGAIWFPTPPGVSTLPTTPSSTVNGSPVPANSGSLPEGWNPAAPDLTALFTALPTSTPPVFPTTLDVDAGLLPFTETVALDGVTRSVLSVVDRPYSLAPLSGDADMVTRSVFVAAQIVLVKAPLTSLTLAALTPAAYVPQIVPVPAAALSLAAVAPAAVKGAAYVPVPATSFTMAALAPSVEGDALTDPDFASVSLLLHMDGTNGSTTFTDSSSFGRTITRSGNTQISTAQSKFGGAGALFDGSSDFLTMADAAELELTGDFTIETQCYPLSTTDRIIAGHNTQNVQVFRLNWAGSGWLGCFLNGTSIGPFTAGIVANSWQHLAIARSGSNTRIFVEGTQIGTTETTWTGSFKLNLLGGMFGLDFNGYLDEFRVTKGVARYTSNFTPPTAAFPDA